MKWLHSVHTPVSAAFSFRNVPVASSPWEALQPQSRGRGGAEPEGGACGTCSGIQSTSHHFSDGTLMGRWDAKDAAL